MQRCGGHRSHRVDQRVGTHVLTATATDHLDQTSPPGTGVASYDVQHRWESGGWQTVSMTTIMTEATHWFRVQARDGAGNESSYTAAISTLVHLTAPTIALVSIAEASAHAQCKAIRSTVAQSP